MNVFYKERRHISFKISNNSEALVSEMFLWYYMYSDAFSRFKSSMDDVFSKTYLNNQPRIAQLYANLELQTYIYFSSIHTHTHS